MEPWALATLLVIVFFVTSSDSGSFSGSFVDDMVTSGGHPNPPRIQRPFWAVADGTVAAALLDAGARRDTDVLRFALDGAPAFSSPSEQQKRGRNS